VAETTAERLLFCGYRRACIRDGTSVSVLVVMSREIDVFTRFDYRIFYVLYAFVTYLLTPS
jgi:hypothetical protein